MSELVIRLALEKDIAEICRILGQLSPMGYQHDYTGAVEKFRTAIQPNPDCFLWVAERGGQIVATAMMHLQHKLSYRCGVAAHLEDVVVDRVFRGQGIGEKLVERAVEAAGGRGCYKIMLTCYEKTASYYERFGFQRHDIGMRLALKDDLYDRAQSS